MKFPLLKLDIAHLGSYITTVVSRWISGKNMLKAVYLVYYLHGQNNAHHEMVQSQTNRSFLWKLFINFAWSVLRVLDMFVIPWGQGNYCLWKNVNFNCQDIFQSSISSLHIDANMSKKFMKLNGGGVWTKTDLLP